MDGDMMLVGVEDGHGRAWPQEQEESHPCLGGLVNTERGILHRIDTNLSRIRGLCL